MRQAIINNLELIDLVKTKNGFKIFKNVKFDNYSTIICVTFYTSNDEITEKEISDKLSRFFEKGEKHIKRHIKDSNFIPFINSILNSPTTVDQKIKRLRGLKRKVQIKMHLKRELEEERASLLSIIQDLQIDEYHNFFQRARQNKRKLKLYIGPTNSGKTFHALNDLVAHGKGAYLSPLRLLALEGQEEIQKRGHQCDLITGEEREIFENSLFKAQTIETLNFNESYDAVLIDEIQMLKDYSRGWAWAQAFIGANAKEVIMAGSPDIEPLVVKIASILNEELEIIRLDRFNPLEISKNPFNSLKELPEGSAIICFSRKNVLDLKSQFSRLKMPVSVIYGNLSPDVRKEEARKFKDGQNKYLISTDAIAMGLNLPISHVIFSTTRKYDGYQDRGLIPMEIKQIGGRAGRFGKVEKGVISAFSKRDLDYISHNISKPDKCNDFLYIKPNLEHITKISSILQTEDLSKILIFFENKIMKQNKLYICADLKEQIKFSMFLKNVNGLTLEEKFLFVNAPIPNEDFFHLFSSWIRNYVKGVKVNCPTENDLRFLFPEKLFILENYSKLLNLYTWCAFKKPEIFSDLEKAKDSYHKTNSEIEAILSKK